MDHPRLVGWSSLHRARRRSLTPFVAATGTATSVPGPRGSTCRAETAAAPHLTVGRERRSERLPSCRDRAGCPVRRDALRHRDRWANASARTVLASEPPPGASARRAESPSTSAAPSARLAASPIVETRDASDRFLPSHVFVRAPAPRRFSMYPALARWRACTIEESPASRQCVSLRRTVTLGSHRDGRCLPVAMRAGRASDTPVASPLESWSLARPCAPVGAA
jgi:hypothetical protein